MDLHGIFDLNPKPMDIFHSRTISNERKIVSNSSWYEWAWYAEQRTNCHYHCSV